MPDPNKIEKDIELADETETSVEDGTLSATELDEISGAGHNWGGG